jgi:predicted N-formylglutamate amidohydrolase
VSRADYLIVSCEHGGNRVPARFRKLFSRRFLASHRGFDPGALVLARDFASAARAPLFYSTTSRLLVELNRPLGHPQIFHRDVPEPTRPGLLRRYYLPYWRRIENAIARAIRRGRRVLHVSVHSFTPRLRGVRRSTDVGLLFDPRRRREAALSACWKKQIERKDARLVVRYNDPYAGVHPSVVQSMRETFSPARYIGIQIEINQKFARRGGRAWRALRETLVESFASRRPRSGSTRPYA